MKLFAPALALLLIFGAAMALPGPASVEAAPCASARVAIYNGTFSTYSIGLSVPSASAFSTKTYERLESGIPVQTIVTTSKSYTWASGINPPLTANTTFRVTAGACVAEYNPPDLPGAFYSNGPI